MSGHSRLTVFRDEDYYIGLLAKCKQLVTNEGNDFLGQVMIDFGTLIGATDLWYTLGQIMMMMYNGDGMLMMMLPW